MKQIGIPEKEISERFRFWWWDDSWYFLNIYNICDEIFDS
jgi:hypothetical protein